MIRAVIVAALVATTQCPTPKPVPPVPAARQTLAIDLVSSSLAPLVGVVTMDEQPAPIERTTDAQGHVEFNLIPGPRGLLACALGYVCARKEAIDNSLLNGGATVRTLTVILIPDPPKLPNLRTRGQFFEGEDGSRFSAIECSDFHLLARFQHGENIEPLLQQRQDVGCNLLRVWTLYTAGTIGVELLNPDYGSIPALMTAAARHGMYIEFTAYVQPELQDPLHWTRLIDAALKSTPYPLLELVNEQDQHPIDLGPFSPAPSPLLSAHGSNGAEHQPVLPHWSYATFHSNSAYEWPRKVGHNAMEIWSGPTLSNENTRAPDRFSSELNAYEAAAGAALLPAGSCFHSVQGKTSVLWDDQTYALALAWANGAKSVPLHCQDGEYVHRTDEEVRLGLDQAHGARVYQRGNDPACEVVIHPEQ